MKTYTTHVLFRIMEIYKSHTKKGNRERKNTIYKGPNKAFYFGHTVYRIPYMLFCILYSFLFNILFQECCWSNNYKPSTCLNWRRQQRRKKMKFGENLSSFLTPEWRTQYVQYDVSIPCYHLYHLEADIIRGKYFVPWIVWELYENYEFRHRSNCSIATLKDEWH